MKIGGIYISSLEVLLIISAILEFNPILQAIKIVRLKQTKEVSLLTFLGILSIGVLWFVYGIQIKSLPLIIGNAIKLFSSLTVIIVYYIYK